MISKSYEFEKFSSKKRAIVEPVAMSSNKLPFAFSSSLIVNVPSLSSSLSR